MHFLMHNMIRMSFVSLAVAGLFLTVGAKAAAAPENNELVSVSESFSEPEVIRQHKSQISGKNISYQTTAGRLTLTDQDNVPTAHMFYVAYTVPGKQNEPERPVTFIYNGGPGSASLWLHMGGIAPIVVKTDTPDATRPPPYVLKDNPHSLLDKSDLVFLDAVGTGYSRLTDPEYASLYYGIDADADAFSQAIRRYVSQNNRWNSPKYLMGESYGGPRSAVLSHKLQSSGIQLNGVILISPILNFGQHASGLDREPVNLLPTYAGIAYYHSRTARHSLGLKGHVDDARQFALNDYAAALAKGHRLDAESAARTAAELERLTGLSQQYWLDSDLRVLAPRFAAELLRDEGKFVGRMDGRTSGAAPDRVREVAATDPSGEMNGAYTALYLSYLKTQIGYESDMEYRVNNGNLMSAWKWSHQPPGAPFQYSGANTTVDLAVAMRTNPHLKVLFLSGYYDLVTPFFATEWDLTHMPLEPELARNITEKVYEGGHMFYTNTDELRAMKRDLDDFYVSTQHHRERR